MNQGWVTLQRKILDWEWYNDHQTTRLWIHILLKANHKDKRYQGKLVPKGSFLTGRDVLANETGLTVQQIRTSLSRLKSTSEITIKSTNKGSHIFITRWDDYQSIDHETTSKSTSKLTNEQPASNQQVTTNNNVNNDNNVNNNNNKARKKFKKPKILNTKSKDLEEVVNFYNQVFEKDISSTKGFEKNFSDWIKIHDLNKIKLAVQNAYNDKYWHDKMTLTILFRQKNSNGEHVDYIEDLANRSQQKGNIAVL